jgi:hypothetical protein
VTPTGGSATLTNKCDCEYDLANNLKKERYTKVGGWDGDRINRVPSADVHDRVAAAA